MTVEPSPFAPCFYLRLSSPVVVAFVSDSVLFAQLHSVY